MTQAVVVELGTGALLLYGIPFIIVVGWFSSRILGVRRGWGRSLVAGFVGWTFGVVIAAAIDDQDIRSTGDVEHVLFLAFFIRLAHLDVRRADPRHHPEAARQAAALASTGPAPDRHREAQARAARAVARDPPLRAASAVSPTHPSAAKLASPDFARRLRLTLEDCGGMFVKFGQIASTRTDLLPEVAHRPSWRQLQSSAAPGAGRRGPRGARERARRDRRGGVRSRSTSSRSPPRRSARPTVPS